MASCLLMELQAFWIYFLDPKPVWFKRVFEEQLAVYMLSCVHIYVLRGNPVCECKNLVYGDRNWKPFFHFIFYFPFFCVLETGIWVFVLDMWYFNKNLLQPYYALALFFFIVFCLYAYMFMDAIKFVNVGACLKEQLKISRLKIWNACFFSLHWQMV